MKSLIASFIGLVLSVSVGAEPLLEGQVRLSSGQPATGVQVRLFDWTDLHRFVGTTTDETGHFALPLRAFSTARGTALPTDFALGQNYPNPFNPSTIIPYQLPTAGHVRLEVFNLLGQRLATLVDAEQAAGIHTAQWDATDVAGRAVGAGVYIYRLSSGEMTESRRMVLVDGQAGIPAAGAAPVSVRSAGEGLVEADGSVYGLTVSGEGLVAYVNPTFRVGVDEVVDIVVEEHSSARMKLAAGGVLGDVDGNGLVDVFDVLYVLLYSVDSSIVLPNNGDISRGDVNGDGLVDAADGVLLLRYLSNPSDPALPPIGQDPDNTPVNTEYEEYTPAVGLIVRDSGTEIVRVESGQVTGEIEVGHGKETALLSVRFIAEDGDLFTPDAGDGYALDWEIADESIAEVEHYAEDGAWAFHIIGLAEGQTTIRIKINYEDHTDFVSPEIEIHVEESGPGFAVEITPEIIGLYDTLVNTFTNIFFAALVPGTTSVPGEGGGSVEIAGNDWILQDYSPDGALIINGAGALNIDLTQDPIPMSGVVTFSGSHEAVLILDMQLSVGVDGLSATGTITINGAEFDVAELSAAAALSNPSDPALPPIGQVGQDPDGTLEGATPVDLGSSTDGSLSEGDTDYFRVEMSSAGTLTAYTTGSVDTEGAILDGSGTVLARDSDSGERFNFRVSVPVDAGTYYIEVKGWRSSTTGDYTLDVQVQVQEADGTLEGATPVDLGSSTDGSLSEGDTDYFRVEMSSAGTLTVYTTGSTDTYGFIFDSSGNVLAENDDGGEGRNFWVSAPVSAGTYHIQVEGFSSSTGDYTLHVVDPLDLVVTVSVSDSTLAFEQPFTLRATVRNQGSGEPEHTVLFYYRSTDATITSDDTQISADVVANSLSLTAPAEAGTYYYGACIQSVSGEHNPDNNCSDAVRVTVSSEFVYTPSDPSTLSQMYWTVWRGGIIYRASLDGSNVEPLVTRSSEVLAGLALDVAGDQIYWTGIDSGRERGFIYRASLDGSNIEPLVTGEIFPRILALDVARGQMYWTDPQEGVIYHASLDGSNVEALITGLNTPGVLALDVAGGQIYWTDLRRGIIYRASLDGSNVEALITGLDEPGVLALDVAGGQIYWTDSEEGVIYRASLDGSNVEALITGLDEPVGLALDLAGGQIYWTDFVEGGGIYRASLDGSNIEPLVTGLNRPLFIVLGP